MSAELSPTLSNEALVKQAVAGDEAALEAIIGRIQGQVYNLALRMLWYPADAEDATQEILIRVITHLSQFRGESSFTTWVYRVATNHLLTTRKRRAETREMTFEDLGQRLDAGLALTADSNEGGPERVEHRQQVEEVLLSCTLGMLLCLEREQRLTFLLAEVFEVSSDEGAYIMDVSPATFRKRLSRARERMHAFLESKCGLVNSANPCRCARQLPAKIKYGGLDPDNLMFANPDKHVQPQINRVTLLERVEELEKLDRVAGIFRSHPTFAAPGNFAEAIRQLLRSGKFKLLEA